MNEISQTLPEPLFAVPGAAADHLYREGSAKASFWEAIFGSSLRAKNRAHISALADGTRMFDIPLHDLEAGLLRRAETFLATTAGPKQGGQSAAGVIAASDFRVRLLGLQPRGQSVAAFSLRFERRNPATESASVADAFRSWFAADGAAVTRDLLIPFGFTPR